MVKELVVVVVVWLADQLVPWSVLVSLALWWGRSKVTFRPSRLFALLFLGLMEDIVMVHCLGLTSILAVSLMTIAWLVARYYQNRQLWWWYGLGLLGELLMMAIQGIGFSWWRLILQLGCLGVLHGWSERFGKRDTIYVQT